MYDVGVGVVEEGGAGEGGRGRGRDGVGLLTVTLALALERVTVRHAARVVAARPSHARVRTVVHVHAGQRLGQDVQRLVVDHHLQQQQVVQLLRTHGGKNSGTLSVVS